jgi:hypothetical protein
VLAEAFLLCAMSLPPKGGFAGNHDLSLDDGHAFLALMEPARKAGLWRPPIVFVYNYFDLSNQLRAQGIRAFSMTISMTGAHVHGMLDYLPFKDGSIGSLVLLQKVTYSNLFEAIDAVAIEGVLLIKETNLPYLGEILLSSMGFRKTLMAWHGLQIYRKAEIKTFTEGIGYETFNTKKVLSPYLVHQSMLTSA